MREPNLRFGFLPGTVSRFQDERNKPQGAEHELSRHIASGIIPVHRFDKWQILICCMSIHKIQIWNQRMPQSESFGHTLSNIHPEVPRFLTIER